MNIKESLGTKVGPLPMAAWGAIAIVLVIVYSAYKKQSSGASQTSNGTADTSTTLPIGYSDANGNPIVPGWTTLPTTPPDVDTTVPGNGGTVSTPPTGTVPPATTPGKTPTPTPGIHSGTGTGHGTTPPVHTKRPAPVARPKTTQPLPVSHKTVPTHAATPARPPVATPKASRPPIKASTVQSPVNRRQSPATLINNAAEGKPLSEHSGSRVGDLTSHTGAVPVHESKTPIRSRVPAPATTVPAGEHSGTRIASVKSPVKAPVKPPVTHAAPAAVHHTAPAPVKRAVSRPTPARGRKR